MTTSYIIEVSGKKDGWTQYSKRPVSKRAAESRIRRLIKEHPDAQFRATPVKQA